MSVAREVAGVILEQLGGRRVLGLMLGNRCDLDVVDTPLPGLWLGGLQAEHPGCRIDAVRILLDPSDTYTVESFGPRYRPTFDEYAAGDDAWREKFLAAQKPLDTLEGIYDDMLVECVENMSGLSLRLPFVRSPAP
jgi:hypothetical protein